jgi:hypothetical protein
MSIAGALFDAYRHDTPGEGGGEREQRDAETYERFCTRKDGTHHIILTGRADHSIRRLIMVLVSAGCKRAGPDREHTVHSIVGFECKRHLLEIKGRGVHGVRIGSGSKRTKRGHACAETDGKGEETDARKEEGFSIAELFVLHGMWGGPGRRSLPLLVVLALLGK